MQRFKENLKNVILVLKMSHLPTHFGHENFPQKMSSVTFMFIDPRLQVKIRKT